MIFGEVAAEAKLEQATTTFTPEMERLAALAETSGGVETLARGVPVPRVPDLRATG